MSADTALTLMKKGYKNVYVPIGGLEKLPEAGFPLYLDGSIIQKIGEKWYKNGQHMMQGYN